MTLVEARPRLGGVGRGGRRGRRWVVGVEVVVVGGVGLNISPEVFKVEVFGEVLRFTAAGAGHRRTAGDDEERFSMIEFRFDRVDPVVY